MQPHSISVLAMVQYLWNYHSKIEVSEASIDVEFYSANGGYRLLKYRLFNFQENKDRTELRVTVMRDGGGLSCTVNARRSSSSRDSEITMTHDTNHVSGLREVFRLGSNSIDGRHYNSLKYDTFKGDASHPDRKEITMYCDVKRKNQFVTITYKVRIRSVSRRS